MLREIPLVQGSFEALTTLNEKFDIYIVTSRHAVCLEWWYVVVYESSDAPMVGIQLSWSD